MLRLQNTLSAASKVKVIRDSIPAFTESFDLTKQVCLIFQSMTYFNCTLRTIDDSNTFIGGEVDVRGCYTAVATAHMLGLEKDSLAKQAGMVNFVTRCQVHHPDSFSSHNLICLILQGITQTNKKKWKSSILSTSFEARATAHSPDCKATASQAYVADV